MPTVSTRISLISLFLVSFQTFEVEHPALLKLSLETALFEAITDLACAMQLQFCDQQSAWLQDFDVSP